jgi:WD40 repeat protein
MLSESALRNRLRSPLARRVRLVALAITALLVPAQAAFSALPETATLELNRTIQTSPFSGTSVSMGDHEGSAFIPADNSLWLADDAKKRIYEVDPTTGALKRTIERSVFNNAPQLGGGPLAGTIRTNDFESMAYDRTNDVLYVFSGPCCNSSILATAFRLTRQSGQFQVESYQPLPTGADYTGAAWSPTDGKIYVGKGRQLRSFDYASATEGAPFSVAGVKEITGMDFSPDGTDLFVTVGSERLIRINWSTRTVVSGWTFDLTPFGVRDARAVAEIGDQFFVSDGVDSRASGDPLKYAVFVFDATATEPPPNLVGNPGFEVDSSGWSTSGSGSGVTLTRVEPGRNGSAGAALLTNGSSALKKCLLNDTPNWVTNTAAATYTAGIWVRADSPGATIKLKLIELDGATVVRSRTASRTLGTSWEQLTVALSSVPSGRSLDVQVFLPSQSAPPGTCFYADHASITAS